MKIEDMRIAATGELVIDAVEGDNKVSVVWDVHRFLEGDTSMLSLALRDQNGNFTDDDVINIPMVGFSANPETDRSRH